MFLSRSPLQTAYVWSWFISFGIGCSETEHRQHIAPSTNRESSQKTPANQVHARSLVGEIKLGEPLSRHHRKLAAHAAKVGGIIFGGSGSGEVFYRIGEESVRVRFTGPSSAIHSANVHNGEWPDGLEVGEAFWMSGRAPVDFDILRHDKKSQWINE